MDSLPNNLKLDENEEMKTNFYPDLLRDSLLTPDYTKMKKEWKEKIGSLISLRSGPCSPSVSQWSDTSDTSIFTFPGSEVSPAGPSPRLSPRLSPRPTPLLKRPISPLVSSVLNKAASPTRHHQKCKRSYGSTRLSLALSWDDLEISHS